MIESNNALKEKPNDLNRGEVLVAVMNNKADFAILQEQLWYRIPVASAPKRCFPNILLYIKTKIFENEGWAVNYYGAVRDVQVVERKELFLTKLKAQKAERKYYRVRLESLEKLALHSKQATASSCFHPNYLAEVNSCERD